MWGPINDTDTYSTHTDTVHIIYILMNIIQTYIHQISKGVSKTNKI